MKEWWVGAHVSAEGGLHKAVWRAKEIGATAFALFLKNQRQWSAPTLKNDQIDAFQSACREAGFGPSCILPHNSYLINLASPDAETLEKSRQALKVELLRCHQLGLTAINIHPGSTLGRTVDEVGLDQIAQSINALFEAVPSVKILLENTAGQGNHLGFRLEHLAHIIDRISDKSRIGVCLDTCHAFAAGYCLRSAEACDRFFHTFDRIIGAQYLQAMHLNDSKGQLGSRVDRHASLGEGHIGWAVFRYIAVQKRFQQIPLILETPDSSRWSQEIAILLHQGET